jgi:hypothetical protein
VVVIRKWENQDKSADWAEEEGDQMAKALGLRNQEFGFREARKTTGGRHDPGLFGMFFFPSV